MSFNNAPFLSVLRLMLKLVLIFFRAENVQSTKLQTQRSSETNMPMTIAATHSYLEFSAEGSQEDQTSQSGEHYDLSLQSQS